jgi:hypothetical protein
MVLTLGCGKYRFYDQDMGTLPNGLPRLLDMGWAGATGGVSGVPFGRRGWEWTGAAQPLVVVRASVVCGDAGRGVLGS